jgi:hypothetical protein
LIVEIRDYLDQLCDPFTYTYYFGEEACIIISSLGAISTDTIKHIEKIINIKRIYRPDEERKLNKVSMEAKLLVKIIVMAAIKGSYTIWDKSKFIDHPTTLQDLNQENLNEHLYEDPEEKEKVIRNDLHKMSLIDCD